MKMNKTWTAFLQALSYFVSILLGAAGGATLM